MDFGSGQKIARLEWEKGRRAGKGNPLPARRAGESAIFRVIRR
jgi:hypothetical protein